MSWPMVADFSSMLQNPKIALRDDQLKRCTIARANNNRPRCWSGSFAAVYKGIRPDGSGVALRAFTSEANGGHHRYLKLSKFLNRLTLPFLVEFKFQEKGIRATDGKWYPLLEMDWVVGVTLYEWTDARCHENDGAALTRAADQWIKLVEGLQAAGIAHGDLQHGNVMVTDSGEFKLVDYDCMFVPSLAGQRNPEIGVEPYQHPQRDETTILSPRLDDFSVLFIWVVLKGLAAAPDLWQRYMRREGEDQAYDKLLLRKSDLDRDPTAPLCQELLSSPDHEVRRLMRLLLQSWHDPIDQVPRLSDIIDSSERGYENSNGAPLAFSENLQSPDQKPRFTITPRKLGELPFLEPAQSSEEIGRLSSYRIFGVLGEGGMGIVLRGEDLLAGRQVAIKVLRAEFARDKETRARFLRQAGLAASLEHVRIVPIYRVDEVNDTPFMVMPLLKGASLESRLTKKLSHATTWSVRIGLEIAEGLAVAHAEELIHGDIKPANVWIKSQAAWDPRDREHAILLDCGMARPRHETSLHTNPGTLIGTACYMAPEQAAGEEVDHRCDQFSLGCVMYELCTGISPFDGPNLTAVLGRLANYEPPAPVSVNGTLPLALSDLISQLMQKDRAWRPGTVNEVVERLHSIGDRIAT